MTQENINTTPGAASLNFEEEGEIFRLGILEAWGSFNSGIPDVEELVSLQSTVQKKNNKTNIYIREKLRQNTANRQADSKNGGQHNELSLGRVYLCH